MAIERNRFFADNSPGFKRAIIVDGFRCNYIGITYMKYPIYACPDLDTKVLRSLSNRLFSRPWKPFARFELRENPQWIFKQWRREYKHGHKTKDIILVNPREASRLWYEYFHESAIANPGKQDS